MVIDISKLKDGYLYIKNGKLISVPLDEERLKQKEALELLNKRLDDLKSFNDRLYKALPEIIKLAITKGLK